MKYPTLTSLAALALVLSTPAHAQSGAQACKDAQDSIQSFLDAGPAREATAGALESIHKTLGREGLSDSICESISSNASEVIDIETRYRARLEKVKALGLPEIAESATAEATETGEADATATGEAEAATVEGQAPEATEEAAATDTAATEAVTEETAAAETEGGTETAEAAEAGADAVEVEAKPAEEAEKVAEAVTEETAEPAAEATEEAEAPAEEVEQAEAAPAEGEAAEVEAEPETAAETTEAEAETEETSETAATAAGTAAVAAASATGSEAEAEAEPEAEGAASKLKGKTIESLTVDSLIGREVYSGDAEVIGEVDMVVMRDNVPNLIVSYGGFLGFGKTEVGFPADDFLEATSNVLLLPSVTQEEFWQMEDWDEGDFPEAEGDKTISDLTKAQ